MAWVCGAYRQSKEKRAEGENSRYFWARVVSLYQQGLEAASFEKRASDVHHRWKAVLERFATFGEVPGIVPQSL